MRKILACLILCLFITLPTFAVAPTIEEANVIQFTATDQETDTMFIVKSIVWISAAGSEIAAANGFLLEDGNGTTIAAGEATALSDYLVITIPDGILVGGLKAEDLDAGYLYVYGQRR